MSSRRTYDTQIITVRQVNALHPDNSLIAPLKVLTSDGAGGTYWAVPSASAGGGLGAINQISVNNTPFVSDLSYNTFRLNTSHGLGCITNPLTNTATLYGKGYETIYVEGGNTLNSFSNGIVSPSFTFVGANGISISSDPMLGKIYINGQASTSPEIYGYNQVNVISNLAATDNSVLTALSPTSVLTMIGTGDILLSTNVTNNMVFVGISSFTSRGYNDLSGVAYGTFSSCMSTVSTLFQDKLTSHDMKTDLQTSIENTSNVLRAFIQRGDDNVMNNYTNIDLFKILSTNVRSNISFTSTLNISNHRGVLTGTVLGSDYTISSASLRLDSVSSIINATSKINISHSPSLRFDFSVPGDTMFYVSSFLRSGTNIFANTTFVRPWLVRSGTVQQLYTDSIRFIVTGDVVNTSLTSSYTICHRVENFNVTPGTLGNNAEALISGDNTLSMRIN